MNNKTITTNKYKFGMLIVIGYILTGYLAQDIILPAIINSIFLVVLIIYALFFIANSKRHKIDTYTKLYFVFLVEVIISILYSKVSIYNSSGLYLTIVTFIVVISIKEIVNNKDRFNMLAITFIVASTLLNIILLLTGKLIGDETSRLGEEIFGNANNYAIMIMVGVMFSFWLLVYSKRKPMKPIIILTILLNMYALILSGGRKFFFLPFLFLYLLLLQKTDKHKRKRVIKSTIIVIAIIAVIYYLIMNVPAFYSAIGHRTQLIIDGITGTGTFDSGTVKREMYRSVGFSKWIESPLWGHGIDSFQFIAKEIVGKQAYSHCNYTELLYSGGIIMFISYYAILIILLVRAWSKKHSPYKAFAIALVICLFVFDYGAVSYNSTYIHLMIAIAYISIDFSDDQNPIQAIDK